VGIPTVEADLNINVRLKSYDFFRKNKTELNVFTHVCISEKCTFTSRGKLHIDCQVVAHRLLDSCTKRELNCTHKSSSKHTHVESSFEEHVAKIPTVKTDRNSDAQIESYAFL
jgi:hypothetical protein